MKSILSLLVFLVATATIVSAASLKLPQAISSHMVLQRAPQSAKLWGWAAASDTVTVAVAGVQTSVAAGTDGTWTAVLPPVKTGGPYEVTISTKSGESLTLTDVMFGDVFICSGQSNMEFVLSQAFNGSVEVADSVNYPNLRVMEVAENYAMTPLDDMTTRSNLQWGASSASTVGGNSWSYFSAVCYLFGRDVYRYLNGTVPIGLIATTYGGTCIEAWSSAEIVNNCTTEPSSQCYWSPSSSARHTAHARHHHTPEFTTPADTEGMPKATNGLTEYSGLYNAMMHPLIKFAITGFTWYQGENNWQDLVSFECRMPMFVQDIRNKFQNQNLPFFYVDCGPGFGADLRDAQASALKAGNVYRTNIIDLGDPASPYVWYHPRNKQTVGERLMLQVLHVVYNESLTFYGPAPVSVSVTSSGSTSTLDLVMDKTKLNFGDTAECTECCAKAMDVFQVASADGTKWYNATSYSISTSQPGHITITANVENASGVSLDWTTYPSCALYDSVTTLPAAPFQVFANPKERVIEPTTPVRHRSHRLRHRKHHN